MYRKLFVTAIITVILLPACAALPPGSTPTPIDMAELQTRAMQTAYAMLTASAPPVTETPLPAATNTSLPPTPTVDLSVIKFSNIYFNGPSQMVVVYTLNGVRGSFHVTGNEYAYECAQSTDNPDQLLCRGAYQAPGKEVIFSLYAEGWTDALLILDMIIPSDIPPTPVGMYCEIEKLWLAFPGQFDVGCYSVTCYLNGGYFDGTPNTCVTPWRYPIP